MLGRHACMKLNHLDASLSVGLLTLCLGAMHRDKQAHRLESSLYAQDKIMQSRFASRSPSSALSLFFGGGFPD